MAICYDQIDDLINGERGGRYYRPTHCTLYEITYPILWALGSIDIILVLSYKAILRQRTQRPRSSSRQRPSVCRALQSVWPGQLQAAESNGQAWRLRSP
jgi:hypothetical protein